MEMTEIPAITMPENLYKAILVMNGAYGNGEERKNKLGKDFNDVQSIVNVIAPFWG